MQTITTKLFKNGQSQAVRIPKRKSWLSFAEVDNADDDFMDSRPELIETTRVTF
ncbi:MAG: hypothetical protein HOP34_07310 [Methylococcaceae bacterium]|nr:hypothetical protein [Methylococcaceae bacterium]